MSEPDQRLDRQMRIEGCNHEALENANIGVCGDDDTLASMYVMSASALGINEIAVIAPYLDSRLVETAEKVNPKLNLIHIEGYYTHPALDNIFSGCNILADLTQYGLANKLLIQKGFFND